MIYTSPASVRIASTESLKQPPTAGGDLFAPGADDARKPDQAHADQRLLARPLIELHPEMRGDHTQGLLIAMHKNRLADAYVLYLFNDYQPVKEEINQLMSVLSFLP